MDNAVALTGLCGSGLGIARGGTQYRTVAGAYINSWAYALSALTGRHYSGKALVRSKASLYLPNSRTIDRYRRAVAFSGLTSIAYKMRRARRFLADLPGKA